MNLSDNHKKEFDFSKALDQYKSTGNTVEKMVDREHCGLYKISDSNKKMICILCKSELEVFLFSFSINGG